MQRWEYATLKMESTGFLGGKVDTTELHKLLNQAGMEGWELVSAFDTNQYEGRTRYIVLVMKRPLP